MAKGSWFSSVKKALGLRSKRSSKSKKILLVNEMPSASDLPNPESFEVSNPHPPPQLGNMRSTELENEQTKHAHSVAVAAAVDTEVEIAAVEATPEVVPLPTVTQVAGKHQEEVAALKIQTAFRGYLARRALRALRGLVRLKSLVDGPAAERQTSNTLKCLQTLSRLQSQIQSRRTRMLDESRAVQRQLLQRRVKELDSLRMAEEWDDSLQTKEETEASLLHKYEAAMRRERALAYSYTHQQTWKKSAKLNNLLFMDPTNPHWGWSWLERWMAATPLETKNTAGKDLNGDHLSIKIGEITKSFARHQLNSDNPSPAASQKASYGHRAPAIPSPKAVSSLAARKLRNASPKVSMMSQEDDSRSVFSVQSERNRRRHSIAGSVRDDESLDSSPSIPSYMTPTRSAKARFNSQSPSGLTDKEETAAFAKKRLSFPPSPGRARRHSGPPKVETSSLVNGNVNGGLVN
ncbi:protein IQ-DOMAIN 2-like [Salvia miltiorrhiza]|uniref:protein IQ-DOMAIN 2-like n=1 Tax=Salvia miltiorrhiza TaxID=226208 RepID=UPI0025ABCC33|nr:protein IQ-DOMAIN 2-like [Salvia miltiorrhiza]